MRAARLALFAILLCFSESTAQHWQGKEWVFAWGPNDTLRYSHLLRGEPNAYCFDSTEIIRQWEIYSPDVRNLVLFDFDSLPDEISRFQHLESICLVYHYKNALAYCPKALASLPRLKSIYIANHLAPDALTFTEQTLQDLIRNPGLETIQIYLGPKAANQFPLQLPEALKILKLRKLCDILPSSGSFPNVIWLEGSLSGCQYPFLYKNVDYFYNWTHLERLTIRQYLQIDTLHLPDQIANLHNLRRLDLPNVEYISPQILQCKELHYVSANYLSTQAMKILAKLPALDTLDMREALTQPVALPRKLRAKTLLPPVTP